MADPSTSNPPRPSGAEYVSTPTRIEAIQWDGENWSACVMWAAGKARFTPRPFNGGDAELTLLVDKDGAMGWQVVPVGHWLVCREGDKSDVWPVGADYFAEKYEPQRRPSGEGADRLGEIAVEAAARVIFDNEFEKRHWPWEECYEPVREHYRVIARAALNASGLLDELALAQRVVDAARVFLDVSDGTSTTHDSGASLYLQAMLNLRTALDTPASPESESSE